MKRKFTTCSHCWRAGLTLIEVVASIAILGTILVGVVLAKARYTKQSALAERLLQASQAADELIAGWWGSPDGVPVGRQGALEGGHHLRWETRVVPNPAIESLGARVVRVQILDNSSGSAVMGNEASVTVDLVLPVARGPEPEPERSSKEIGVESDSSAVQPGRQP